MRRIFVIDWILTLLFPLSTLTGIMLHIAGHRDSHEVWHNWAVCHIIVSILFLIFIICHITTHKTWYKGLIRNGTGRKKQSTVIVSAMFIILSLTGLVLFAVDGANSDIGLWHYKTGLVSSAFFLWHIGGRIAVLYKSLH